MAPLAGGQSVPRAAWRRYAHAPAAALLTGLGAGVTRASHLPEILRHVAKAFQDHGVVEFAEVQAAAPGECDRSRIGGMAGRGPPRAGWRQLRSDIRPAAREQG